MRIMTTSDLSYVSGGDSWGGTPEGRAPYTAPLTSSTSSGAAATAAATAVCAVVLGLRGNVGIGELDRCARALSGVGID